MKMKQTAEEARRDYARCVEEVFTAARTALDMPKQREIAEHLAALSDMAAASAGRASWSNEEEGRVRLAERYRVRAMAFTHLAGSFRGAAFDRPGTAAYSFDTTARWALDRQDQIQWNAEDYELLFRWSAKYGGVR